MILTRKPLRLAGSSAIALAMLLGVASVMAAPSGTPKGSVDPSDDNSRVRSLFRKAATASEAGQYEEARNLLLDAWAIRRTYDVASSLAQVELQLKRYRDAAEHLDFCIRNFAPVESEQTLDQAKRAYAEVKSRVAAIRLSANRAGAEIFVDSLGIGTEPLPAVVFVEPGARKLAARLDGEIAEQTLSTQAGKEYVVELRLTPHDVKPVTTAAASVSASVPAPPAASEYHPNYAPAILTASVGGAALITGVVLLIEANHKDSQREDRLNQLPGSNRCGAQNPTPNECHELQSLADDARTFRSLAWVGLGAAAAAGVATYFLWPRTPANAQVGLRAAALPTPSGVNVYAGFAGIF